MDIIEFSIVLVATSNNPSILNSDFLLYNKIVDANLEVLEPRISTPAYSQVRFKGGLTVTADPDRVVFTQTGDRLAVENIPCAEVAKRYVEQVPHVAYRALGVNPKGVRRFKVETAKQLTDVLINKGTWMSFRDAEPEIQLKAIYHYPGRRIVLDIGEAMQQQADGDPARGLLFQANIHRDIADTSTGDRVSRLLSAIDSWQKDLSDFDSVVERFYNGLSHVA